MYRYNVYENAIVHILAEPTQARAFTQITQDVLQQEREFWRIAENQENTFTLFKTLQIANCRYWAQKTLRIISTIL